MKKTSGVIGAILIFLFCYSCSGKNPVSTVKDGVLEFDKSVTVGNAYDNYKYFEKKEWSSFETEQKRNVVEFKGTLPVADIVKKIDYDFKFFTSDYISSIEYTTQFTISADGESFEINYSGLKIKHKDGKEEPIKDSGMTMVESIYKNKLIPDIKYALIDIENGLKKKDLDSRITAIKSEAEENAKKLFLEKYIRECGDMYAFVDVTAGYITVGKTMSFRISNEQFPEKQDDFTFKCSVWVLFDSAEFYNTIYWKSLSPGTGVVSSFLIKKNGAWLINDNLSIRKVDDCDVLKGLLETAPHK